MKRAQAMLCTVALTSISIVNVGAMSEVVTEEQTMDELEVQFVSPPFGRDCPWGGAWRGPGDYCVDGRSVYCQCEGCPTGLQPDGLCTLGGYCSRNSDCAFDDICYDGQCQRANNWRCNYNNECPFGQICFDGTCQLKTWCDNDGDCSWGESCIGSQCELNNNVCWSDRDCRFGNVCMDGQCKPDSTGWCRSHNDCTWDHVCIDGYCLRADNGRCYNDNDCSWGLACAAEGQCRKLSWGESCAYDQQCQGNQLCRRGICEPMPDNALDAFDAPRVGYAIRGHNSARHDKVTQNECAQLCLNQDCASFEYHPGQWVCIISMATSPAVWAPEWDLYIRQQPRPRPVEPVVVYSEGEDR